MELISGFGNYLLLQFENGKIQYYNNNNEIGSQNGQLNNFLLEFQFLLLFLDEIQSPTNICIWQQRNQI